MPIHDRGYRRREAPVPPSHLRALPIARLALAQILARRALIALVALSLIPLLIEVFVLFLLSRFPDFAAMLPPMPEQIGRCVLFQTGFAVLTSVWAGAGLVADDFRTGALLVYFSRPVTRVDYLVGKLSVLLALNLTVTAVPMLLLWLVTVAFDPHDLVGRGLAFLPGSILALSVVASAVLALLAVAAGAATRNAMMGGALVVGVLVVAEVAAVPLSGGAQVPLQMLSIPRHVLVLEHALFGVTPDSASLHWIASLACVGLFSWGAATLVWRRLQAVEVVS
jgi:ABC-2 type transport system permease protein